MKAIEKFRFGIRRIINIQKSKTFNLRDLLDSVKEQIRKEKESIDTRKKSMIMRGGHVSPEQRAEQIYFSLK
ncbi:MAG: hypothetical protein Q9M32_04175 [Sulfurimonas sp.]|nr:hypothetical protein [Sulfurimonas sp.]